MGTVARLVQEGSGAKPPASASKPQMVVKTQGLQSHWQAMLTQQGAQVPVEELLERALLGNASNDSSLMATPLGSNLSVHCQPHVGYHL